MKNPVPDLALAGDDMTVGEVDLDGPIRDPLEPGRIDAGQQGRGGQQLRPAVAGQGHRVPPGIAFIVAWAMPPSARS